MDYQNVKDIAIYGTECIVDISRGTNDTCSFITAKEKYFDLQCDNNGQLTVTQKKGNFFYRIINRRFEAKLVLPINFKGRLRFRNKNGGLYIKGGEFADIELSTSNGKFDIQNIACGELTLKTRNGSIEIKNVKAAQSVFVKCKNGSVKTETVTTPSLIITSNNAGLSAIDIKSDKLECSTHNGSVDVSAVTAADIRLETSNGKINAVVLGARNDYRLSLETVHGAIGVDGTPSKNVSDVASGIKQRITARTSNGDIDLKFI